MVSETMPTFTVGDYIRTARRRAGIDQTQLARAIGGARNTISNWETGRSEPSFEAVVKIASATGVSLDWFVQGVETTKAPVSAGALENVRHEGFEPPTFWFGAYALAFVLARHCVEAVRS